MTPPCYFSIGPFHFILRWGHDWIANGEKEEPYGTGRGYLCWRCRAKRTGKPYAIQHGTLREENGVLVGEIKIG